MTVVTGNRLALAVASTMYRMQDNGRTLVKKAIKLGANVTFFGTYFNGGKWVLRTNLPKEWEGKNWVGRDVDCVIEEEDVQATLEWVKRKYPQAYTGKAYKD